MNQNLPMSVDLTVVQSTTQSYGLVFTVDEVAEDITDFELYFVVKEKHADLDSAAKIKQKYVVSTPASGEVEVSDPTSGQITVTLSATETNLTPGTYYYEISYVDADGAAQVAFYGKFQVMKKLLTTRY